MTVRLSALYAGCPLPPRKIPGTHFSQRLSRPQGHSGTGRIRKIENIHLTGTRTHDLPTCSIVPQPTMLPRRAPIKDWDIKLCSLLNYSLCTRSVNNSDYSIECLVISLLNSKGCGWKASWPNLRQYFYIFPKWKQPRETLVKVVQIRTWHLLNTSKKTYRFIHLSQRCDIKVKATWVTPMGCSFYWVTWEPIIRPFSRLRFY
jgi:hypothetical protein